MRPPGPCLLALVAGLLSLGPASPPADAPAQATPSASSIAIDRERLVADLRTLSGDEMEGRLAGSAGGARARTYVVERFEAAGLEPLGASFEHAFEISRRGGGAPGTGVNVIGRHAGTVRPDRAIVITAHYDHVGVRSGAIYNGANDNASGTAALFALAAWFEAHPPRHTLVFAALDAEEAGQQGARRFVAEPPVPLEQLALNVNMDMIGRDPHDLLYVAGTHAQPFLKPFIERAAASANVTMRMGHDDPDEAGIEDWTRSSDHYPFCEAGIPCLYFGVEDFENHHRPSDRFETMTLDFYYRVVQTIAAAVRQFDERLEQVAR